MVHINGERLATSTVTAATATATAATAAKKFFVLFFDFSVCYSSQSPNED